LVETGYLHNHARMWFASIWIFTLRLPWELGADFFLRHLLDGDPASNTLGWRWVAGIQTPGKTYLARTSNISKFTEGRFAPKWQLAGEATPVPGPAAPDRMPLPNPAPLPQSKRVGLLLHDDDLSPGFLLNSGLSPVATAVVTTRAGLSPLTAAPHLEAFAKTAAADVAHRYKDRLGTVTWPKPTREAIAEWANASRVEQIVTPYAPVGPNADLLSRMTDTDGMPPIACILREYDSAAWPHATHGFFRFKDKIPTLLGHLRGLNAAE
jgi:deoxyribodipyrimidine photo-lyase